MADWLRGNLTLDRPSLDALARMAHPPAIVVRPPARRAPSRRELQGASPGGAGAMFVMVALVVAFFAWIADDDRSATDAVPATVPAPATAAVPTNGAAPTTLGVASEGPVPPAVTLVVDRDLGILGHRISDPACDGSPMVQFVALTPGAEGLADRVAAVLAAIPGSEYLYRGDACPGLADAAADLYVVFRRGFADEAAAQAACDGVLADLAAQHPELGITECIVRPLA